MYERADYVSGRLGVYLLGRNLLTGRLLRRRLYAFMRMSYLSVIVSLSNRYHIVTFYEGLKLGYWSI
jgi:hypothetical protein